MKFSQRIGITPISKTVQIDSIDQELKNGLWNILYLQILNQIQNEYTYKWNVNPFHFFCRSLWHNFFKIPIDSIPSSRYDVGSFIRSSYFNGNWHEAYNLIEHIVDLASDKIFELNISTIKESFNHVLEREFAGYRFIQGYLSPITNSSESESLKTAIDKTNSYSELKGCNLHLREALLKLSDRQHPDFRNSIKESV